MSIVRAFDGNIFDGSETNGNFIFDDSVPLPISGNVVLAYIEDPAENVVKVYTDE